MSAPHDLTELDAATAAKQIRDGRLTSKDITQALLDRIYQRDVEMGAWVFLDSDLALKQAMGADAYQAAGFKLGPLHGVPIAIKDIIDTRDMPTQNGCPIFEGRRPEKDADCVSALRKAGAVILGKTVTTELALLTPAKTKNPVHPKHTPGGSSAGSAAAVADHMVPSALGTQTAGSILRPASYCGIYGFKPTRGVIPRGGVLMQSHTLDTVGVLARSIEDVALLTKVMAVYDPCDDVAISLICENLVKEACALPSQAPKFALVKTPAWEDGEPALYEAFGNLTDQLKDQCEEIEIDNFAQIIEWQRIVQIAENAAYYGPLLDRWPQHISKGLTERILNGRKESVTEYIEAIISRDKAYATVADVLERFDAILTPAAPGLAPEGYSSTGSPIFNGSWTYLGMPALSVPLQRVDGMPVGVQIVGKRSEDSRLLQTGNWLTQHLKAN